MSSMVHEQITESLAVFVALREQSPAIEQLTNQIADLIVDQRRTLYSCGNGGSATDGLHLAEELVGRYRSNRPPLAGVCLNADPTALTCIANDFGYEQIFARQLAGLAHPGDVLVVFSTSGNSPNISAALRTAREKGLLSVALLGKDGGEALNLADHAIVVPSQNTARIQEAHTLLLHLICEAIERRFEPIPVTV